MKLLLVTDTHLGINHSSELYHDVVYKLFKEIKEFCQRENIGTVVHLGDFFHERRSLNTKTQSVAHKIASLFNDKLCMYIVLGNHDIYYKTKLDPTSLDIFKNYPHIEIIKTIKHLTKDITLVPWSLLPNRRRGYVFGHFEFTGFKMNTNYICEIGLDPTKWSDFEHIYSGHFHWPSTRKNITYLGSSYPQTFHDVDSPRGYHIWEDGKLDFIEYTAAPKFIKMKTDDIDHNKIRNNIVKLVFTEDYGSVKNQKIIDEASSFGPARLNPDFSQVKIEGTDEQIETMDASLLDHQAIIREYVNKSELPNFVRKKTLLTMIETLQEDD